MSKLLYDQATNQSNYRAIFENQKEKLIEVFKGDLIYPCNGGFFIAGPELLFEISLYLNEGKTEGRILDINYTPIKVDNLNELYKEIRSIYTESLHKYEMGLTRLKKSRMIPTLTKLHDLEDDVES